MPDFTIKHGEEIKFPSGMNRNTDAGKPNYRLIDIPFLTRLATHMTKGAEIHGRDNWRLANSEEELARFLDSAFRHLMQYLNGEVDEDHASATVFNIMCAEYVKARLEEAKEEHKDPTVDQDHVSACRIAYELQQRLRLGCLVVYRVVTNRVALFQCKWSDYTYELAVDLYEYENVEDHDMLVDSYVQRIKDEHQLWYKMSRLAANTYHWPKDERDASQK